MKIIINFLKKYFLTALKNASFIALGIEAKSPEQSDEYLNKLQEPLIA